MRVETPGIIILGPLRWAFLFLEKGRRLNMPCIPLGSGGFMCLATRVRLRTASGEYIYVEWSHGLPYPFYDKHGRRDMVDWYERPGAEEINDAMRWYSQRGFRG
jgi:hypothetical protein